MNDELIKLSNELSTFKTKNFNLQQEINDIKYKNKIYSQIINEFNKKNKNENIINYDTIDESKREKKFIEYHRIPELTITNMINILVEEYNYKYNEIKDYHTHFLKVLINRNQSKKLERKLNK